MNQKQYRGSIISKMFDTPQERYQFDQEYTVARGGKQKQVGPRIVHEEVVVRVIDRNQPRMNHIIASVAVALFLFGLFIGWVL